MELIVGGVVAFAFLFIIRSLVRAGRWERRSRSWHRGTAQITAVRATNPTTAEGIQRTPYQVQATVSTPDGRSVRGWAAGVYPPDADRWVGATMPAWFDPASPGSFRLDRPRSRGAYAASLLPGVLVLLVVAAVFAGVGYLVWRNG